jgi:hypothetical protein
MKCKEAEKPQNQEHGKQRQQHDFLPFSVSALAFCPPQARGNFARAPVVPRRALDRAEDRHFMSDVSGVPEWNAPRHSPGHFVDGSQPAV